MQKEQRKRVEKDNRDRRTHDQDDPEHDNNRDFNLQHFPDKKRFARKTEGFASYDDNDTLKSEFINLYDSILDSFYLFMICKVSLCFVFF